MSTPGVCPACGAKFPLEAALQDARARAALAAALRCAPALADRIVSYLGLFAPPSGRAVRMDKLARVLDELAALVGGGHVERNGRRYRAPVEVWGAALDDVLGRRAALDLPFTDHAYLAKVATNLAVRGAGEAEARAEEARRERREQPAAPGPKSVADLIERNRGSMPKHVRQHLREQGYLRDDESTAPPEESARE